MAVPATTGVLLCGGSPFEQWILVEARKGPQWELVEYQTGNEEFDLGQPDSGNDWPETAYLAQREFSALVNDGRVAVPKYLHRWKRCVLRMFASQSWGRVGSVLRHLKQKQQCNIVDCCDDSHRKS